MISREMHGFAHPSISIIFYRESLEFDEPKITNLERGVFFMYL